MKKLTSLVTGMLFAMSSFTLVACSDAEQSQPKTSETTTPATTDTQSADKTPKVNPAFETIKVSTSPTLPPYEFKDESGTMVGLDVDLLRAVAEKAKLNVEFVPTQKWNSMFDGLKSDAHDLAMASLAKTAEREKEYELSLPYLYGRDALVMKENVTHINTMQDLKNVRVATQIDTISAKDVVAIHGENNPNSVLVNTNYLALASLIQDKADVVLADEGLLRYHINQMKDQNLKFRFAGTGEVFEPYGMVWLAKKGNTDLIKKLNDGLAQVVIDGTYAKIYEKWLGVAPTPEQMPKVTP